MGRIRQLLASDQLSWEVLLVVRWSIVSVGSNMVRERRKERKVKEEEKMKKNGE